MEGTTKHKILGLNELDSKKFLHGHFVQAAHYVLVHATVWDVFRRTLVFAGSDL